LAFKGLKQIKISVYLNISTHRTAGIESIFMWTGKNETILKVMNKWPGAANCVLLLWNTKCRNVTSNRLIHFAIFPSFPSFSVSPAHSKGISIL